MCYPSKKLLSILSTTAGGNLQYLVAFVVKGRLLSLSHTGRYRGRINAAFP